MMNKNFLGMAERVEQLDHLLLEEDFSLKYKKVKKNNVELEGYVLESKKGNCSPIIYYGEWFKGTDEEVVSFLTEFFHHNKLNVNAALFFNKDYVLEHIRPRLVSESNLCTVKEKDFAYLPFLDMLVLLWMPVDVKSMDEMASVTFSNYMLEKLGISVNEVFSKAVANLEEEVTIRKIEDIIYEINPFMDLAQNCENQLQILVCTNTIRRNGASVLLCSSFLQKIEKIIGEKVVVLPSSVDECIVVPYDTESDLCEYLGIVKTINETYLNPVDVLTDSIYYLENGQLKIFDRTSMLV